MTRFFICFIFVLNAFQSLGNPSDSSYLKDPFFQKLLKTNSQVPVFYNENVRKQIGVYIRNLNNSTAILLGKTQYYYNQNANLFEQKGIPKQLFLVCATNSESNPTFVDMDGASGMWALSYAIAKKYNMTTNSYVDERRNAGKSSVVAADYFKDLNVIYQDWLKSLVAFRSGPINMNMAIHKANNSLDYSIIHNKLQLEFQNTAVNYFAFWYIWNYYAEHKIVPVKYKLPDTDTVQVQREISLSSVAYQLNLSEEVLKQSNSELRIAIVPVSYNATGLRLPKDKVAEYRQKLPLLFPPSFVYSDSAMLKDTLNLGDKIAIQPPPTGSNDETDEDDPDAKKPAGKNDKSNKVFITYVVKKGDGLLLIADLFDCKTSDIKKWNGMKRDAIYKGQKLKIQVLKSKTTQYKKINSMTTAQKKKLAKRS
ncbi:MAG: LysM peptidoglycan-binding domain-containing protein [Bacteroidota bacterium]